MNLPIELPDDLGHRIEGEAVKRGEKPAAFVWFLIGTVVAASVRQSADPITRDLADELLLHIQSTAHDMDRRSGKTLDTLPDLSAPKRPMSNTERLFRQWAEEDATDDPEEIARRQHENAETLARIEAGRFSLEGRTDFRSLAETGGEQAAT